MPQISDNTMEQVRAISIVKVIDPYVELKQRGGGTEYWGLCPFHHEKSPSFKVDDSKGFFKCFGCDAKGDAASFISRKLGFTYMHSLIFLAEKYGIDVEYTNTKNKHTKDILDLHNEIQKFLRKSLYEDNGTVARNYILNRTFTDNDLNEFGIGFAPSRADYSQIFRQFNEETLTKSGYFKKGDYGNINTRFFSRLTLPINNITGSISAFAGRSIDNAMPKYLNSSDSDLFHKRGTLYNIDKAKNAMKSSGYAIIVEGYFDVMRLYTNGLRNVVAPMGTALSKEQIDFIRRYTDEIVVVFDGDAAGEKAAYRSLDNFILSNTIPRTVFLPDNEDPDSFILKHGVDKFNRLIESGEDLLINISKKLLNYSKGDFNKKLLRFQSVKKMLAKLDDPHMRSHYSEAVADIFKLRVDNVVEDIDTTRKRLVSTANKKTSDKLVTHICELDFMACLAGIQIDVASELISDMNEIMFKDKEISQFFKIIVEEISKINDIRNLSEVLGESFIEIISRNIDGDYYKAALSNKTQIFKRHYTTQISQLIIDVKSASSDEERIELIRKINELKNIVGAYHTDIGGLNV